MITKLSDLCLKIQQEIKNSDTVSFKTLVNNTYCILDEECLVIYNMPGVDLMEYDGDIEDIEDELTEIARLRLDGSLIGDIKVYQVDSIVTAVICMIVTVIGECPNLKDLKINESSIQNQLIDSVANLLKV